MAEHIHRMRDFLSTWAVRLLCLGLLGTWCYSLIVAASYFGKEFEFGLHSGLIIFGHHEPINLPWSPLGAFESAQKLIAERNGWKSKLITRRLDESDLYCQTGWTGLGFAIPRFESYPRQADFELKVGM